jgi:hypothetical protein
MRDILTSDTEFYEIQNVSDLGSLVSESFIKAFIGQGILTLFSLNEPVRMGQNLIITSDGILHMILHTQSVPYLGLSVSSVRDKSTNLCIVNIDLKDLVKNPKRRSDLAQIFRDKISQEIPGPFLVSWKPDSEEICPSSVAKYFHDLGADVKERIPDVRLIRSESCLFSEDELCTSDDLDNWVGAKLLNIDPAKLNLQEQTGKRCLIAQCKGLFLRHSILDLGEQLQNLQGNNQEESSGTFLSSLILSQPNLFVPAKCLKKNQKNSSLWESRLVTVLMSGKGDYQVK